MLVQEERGAGRETNSCGRWQQECCVVAAEVEVAAVSNLNRLIGREEEDALASKAQAKWANKHRESRSAIRKPIITEAGAQ